LLPAATDATNYADAVTDRPTPSSLTIDSACRAAESHS
jgi:hypothetical protein